MFKAIFFAAFLPGLLCAQMPFGEVCGQGRRARDLNLTEAQQKQISGICQESFKKVSDLRETWRKAEAELQAAFDESPVDQHKSNDAIEHLTAARSDLFRATSQMDLKIRAVLTDEQWQELKKRARWAGPGRPGGPDGGGRRRGGPPTKSTGPITQPQQQN
ncbi:MAG TPA: periplasmic heavy metal sensor [Bryobacteraceae bacterium]|jgi:Spy/CpxP family protein refolding chaperone|nr:periplasmic heavy metal sensor [Bryobacteraceae bacterium]